MPVGSGCAMLMREKSVVVSGEMPDTAMAGDGKLSSPLSAT